MENKIKDKIKLICGELHTGDRSTISAKKSILNLVKLYGNEVLNYCKDNYLAAFNRMNLSIEESTIFSFKEFVNESKNNDILTYGKIFEIFCGPDIYKINSWKDGIILNFSFNSSDINDYEWSSKEDYCVKEVWNMFNKAKNSKAIFSLNGNFLSIPFDEDVEFELTKETAKQIYPYFKKLNNEGSNLITDDMLEEFEEEFDLS